jgi:hypothetical protein
MKRVLENGGSVHSVRSDQAEMIDFGVDEVARREEETAVADLAVETVNAREGFVADKEAIFRAVEIVLRLMAPHEGLKGSTLKVGKTSSGRTAENEAARRSGATAFNCCCFSTAYENRCADVVPRDVHWSP